MGNFPSIFQSNCNEKLSICQKENRLLKHQLRGWQTGEEVSTLKAELEDWKKGDIVAAGGMHTKTNKKKRKGATKRHK